MQIVLVRTRGALLHQPGYRQAAEYFSKKSFKMKMRQSFVFLFIYFLNYRFKIIDLNYRFECRFGQSYFSCVKEIRNTKVISSVESVICSFNSNKGVRIVFRSTALCPSVRSSTMP